MLISCDEETSKVTVSSQVPKKSLDKINAKAWVGEIQELIKGKGGGKDVNAMASGNDISRVDEAVELAVKFAEMKFA